eukprot:scaffold22741_cov111-Isochrysis_galbana.AAC.5
MLRLAAARCQPLSLDSPLVAEHRHAVFGPQPSGQSIDGGAEPGFINHDKLLSTLAKVAPPGVVHAGTPNARRESDVRLAAVGRHHGPRREKVKCVYDVTAVQQDVFPQVPNLVVGRGTNDAQRAWV